MATYFSILAWRIPMDRGAWRATVHGDSPGKNTGVGCHALLPEDLPNLEIKPRFPALQVDSLPSEPPRKPFENLSSSIRTAGSEKESTASLMISVLLGT